MVSDHIALSFDPTTEMFHIEAEGDTDDIDLELGEADLIDYTIGEANSLFSLDYLKDLFKPYSKGADDEITLELGDEFPVKAHAQFASGAGSQTIMLAPRIQSD
jgi:proliferating cell nuclear antigen